MRKRVPASISVNGLFGKNMCDAVERQKNHGSRVTQVDLAGTRSFVVFRYRKFKEYSAKRFRSSSQTLVIQNTNKTPEQSR